MKQRDVSSLEIYCFLLEAVYTLKKYPRRRFYENRNLYKMDDVLIIFLSLTLIPAGLFVWSWLRTLKTG